MRTLYGFSSLFLWMFSFLHVFISLFLISSDVFGCFHCWLHLFTSLFLYGFFAVILTASSTDLRELFLLLCIFILHSFPAIVKASLWPVILPGRLQGFSMRFETQTQPICLFESQLNCWVELSCLFEFQQLYDKYETLFKVRTYADKLLVVNNLQILNIL